MRSSIADIIARYNRPEETLNTFFVTALDEAFPEKSNLHSSPENLIWLVRHLYAKGYLEQNTKSTLVHLLEKLRGYERKLVLENGKAIFTEKGGTVQLFRPADLLGMFFQFLQDDSALRDAIPGRFTPERFKAFLSGFSYPESVTDENTSQYVEFTVLGANIYVELQNEDASITEESNKRLRTAYENPGKVFAAYLLADKTILFYTSKGLLERGPFGRYQTLLPGKINGIVAVNRDALLFEKEGFLYLVNEYSLSCIGKREKNESYYISDGDHIIAFARGKAQPFSVLSADKAGPISKDLLSRTVWRWIFSDVFEYLRHQNDIELWIDIYKLYYKYRFQPLSEDVFDALLKDALPIILKARPASKAANLKDANLIKDAYFLRYIDCVKFFEAYNP